LLERLMGWGGTGRVRRGGVGRGGVGWGGVVGKVRICQAEKVWLDMVVGRWGSWRGRVGLGVASQRFRGKVGGGGYPSFKSTSFWEVLRTILMVLMPDSWAIWMICLPMALLAAFCSSHSPLGTCAVRSMAKAVT